MKGCNDVLSLTAPFVVRDIHRKYLAAGADIIETNTFNAQRISLKGYGLEAYSRDINLAAAKIARACANEFSTSDKPRYVAGSIGPTSHTTSVATSGEPLDEHILHEAYLEQIQALADGGVDMLLIETIFDTNNASIAIDCARQAAPKLPIMLSFSVSTPDGHNMLGQDIVDFIDALPKDGIISVGINCVTNVPQMIPLVCRLATKGLMVSLYPNAGHPDANGHYSKTPEGLLADVWPLLENHCLNFIGGCCGTTDAHIRQMAKAIEPIKGIWLSPLVPHSQVTTTIPKELNSPHVAEKVETTFSSPEDALYEAILDGKSDKATAATKEAIAKGLNAGKIVKAVAQVTGGNGGGKPDMAMAGAKDITKMDEALASVDDIIKGML